MGELCTFYGVSTTLDDRSFRVVMGKSATSRVVPHHASCELALMVMLKFTGLKN